MAKKGSASKIRIDSFDDLFGSLAVENSNSAEQVVEVSLDELHTFKNHPFRVLDDAKMEETVESIKKYGVLMPGIARPRKEGGYEIIAGHRRKRGSELAGKDTMPIFIRNYTDDEATIIMVDKKQLGFIPGVDIAYLTKEQQYWVFEILSTASCSITKEQAASLKEYGKSGELTKAVQKFQTLRHI